MLEECKGNGRGAYFTLFKITNAYKPSWHVNSFECE